MKNFLLSLALLTAIFAHAQDKPAHAMDKNPHQKWVGVIHRADSNDIVFSFDLHRQKNKNALNITNANEVINVSNIYFVGDSVFIEMPVFESKFRTTVVNGTWQGVWIKG